jgi:hypothetical protein
MNFLLYYHRWDPYIFFNCNFISEDGHQSLKQSRLVMNIPHTSIDCLHLSTYDKYDKFCLKVSIRSKREKYYAMDNLYSGVLLTGHQAESIYRLNDKHCFVMDIECLILRLLYMSSREIRVA